MRLLQIFIGDYTDSASTVIVEENDGFARIAEGIETIIYSDDIVATGEAAIVISDAFHLVAGHFDSMELRQAV